MLSGFEEILWQSALGKIEGNFNQIVSRWQNEGLKEDVLHKLTEKIISVFIALQLKGTV